MYGWALITCKDTDHLKMKNNVDTVKKSQENADKEAVKFATITF